MHPCSAKRGGGMYRFQPGQRAPEAERQQRRSMSDRCACGERLLVSQEKAGGKCMVCMIIEQQEEPEACQICQTNGPEHFGQGKSYIDS